MSQWKRVTAKCKPAEQLKVLGYSSADGIALCSRITDCDGKDRWTVNGTFGWGVKAPTHWMPLPAPPTAGADHE